MDDAGVCNSKRLSTARRQATPGQPPRRTGLNQPAEAGWSSGATGNQAPPFGTAWAELMAQDVSRPIQRLRLRARGASSSITRSTTRRSLCAGSIAILYAWATPPGCLQAGVAGTCEGIAISSADFTGGTGKPVRAGSGARKIVVVPATVWWDGPKPGAPGTGPSWWGGAYEQERRGGGGRGVSRGHAGCGRTLPRAWGAGGCALVERPARDGAGRGAGRHLHVFPSAARRRALEELFPG